MSVANPRENKAARLKAESGAKVRESIGVGRSRETPAAQAKPAKGKDRWDGLLRAKDVATIPIDRIVPDPKQPRQDFEEEALGRLAHSLATRGQLQPIRVRWDESLDKYVIIMGERRFRAAQIAGLTTLTAVIHDRALSEVELRVIQLVENCAREDLNPVELAEALQALQKSEGWNNVQLAEETGLSPATVTRTLQLIALPADVRKLVRSGQLAASSAYELLKVKDGKQQTALARNAAKDGLSREQIIAQVRATTGRAQKSERIKRPAWHTIGLKTAGVSGTLRLKLERKHWCRDLGDLDRMEREGRIALETSRGNLSDAECTELVDLLAHYQSPDGQKALPLAAPAPVASFEDGMAALGSLEEEVRAATPVAATAPDFTVKFGAESVAQEPPAGTGVGRGNDSPQAVQDAPADAPGDVAVAWSEHEYGSLLEYVAEWPDRVSVAVELREESGLTLVRVLERALALARRRERDGPGMQGDESREAKRARPKGGEYRASELGIDATAFDALHDSYSADRLAHATGHGAARPVLRGVATVRGRLYAVLASSQATDGSGRYDRHTLYPLVPFADWEGTTRGSLAVKFAGEGYYRGLRVGYRGADYVLGGAEHELVVVADASPRKVRGRKPATAAAAADAAGRAVPS